MFKAMRENEIARMECDIAGATDRYFEARPESDREFNRELFMAAYERGWKKRREHELKSIQVKE